MKQLHGLFTEHSETSTVINLSKKELVMMIENVELKLSKLLETINSIQRFHRNKSEQIRADPSREIERELWIEFHLNPEKLRTIIQESKQKLTDDITTGF